MIGSRKSACERINEAWRSGNAEWHQVTIVATDKSDLMEISVLWTPTQASLFKELAQGATFKVARKVEVLEEI